MMRNGEMYRHGRGSGFHGHRMAKPLLIAVVLFVVLGLLVMSLWNALLPAIIGVKSIDFWQALGLLVLSRILFGGLGFRPGMFGMARERRRMHERWMQMTPEQREEFIRQRRDGFGHRDRCNWHGRRHDRNATDATPKTPEAE